MSQAFNKIVNELGNISPEEKCALRELLDHELTTLAENGALKSSQRGFGWAKGRISISPDFDAPLDDFRDYTA